MVLIQLTMDYAMKFTELVSRRPRKVELVSAHKKCDDYREYFTHNNEACKNPYKQPYRIDIFIS